MSRRIRFVLVALALVVIVAVCWFMVLSPLRADIATTNASIEAERTKLAAAQAKLAQAETTRQEGKMNQARLLELAKMVPDSEEIPSLLLQIQDLADQSGIDFISITPGEPSRGRRFSDPSAAAGILRNIFRSERFRLPSGADGRRTGKTLGRQGARAAVGFRGQLRSRAPTRRRAQCSE